MGNLFVAGLISVGIGALLALMGMAARSAMAGVGVGMLVIGMVLMFAGDVTEKPKEPATSGSAHIQRISVFPTLLQVPKTAGRTGGTTAPSGSQ